ncbi:MAG: hypothetical protein M3209_08230 [Acidobacteriota bacterium]|nr:hypothetical protein [Acidobacteriota bacterium]
MRKTHLNFTIKLVLMLIYAVSSILAQTTAPPSSNLREETVILTFPRTTEGVSTSQSADRYYIRVSTANNPSVSRPLPKNWKVEVDSSSADELFVYSFPIRSGTFPNAQIKKDSISINYIPPIPSSFVTTTSQPAQTATTSSTSTTVNNGSATRSRQLTNTSTNQPTVPQTNNLDKDKNSIKVASVDLSVPESPAFTVLGLTPQTVTRPASPREFATSLLNGIDQNGNFQSGIALDTAPYLALAGSTVSLNEYRRNATTRFLTRFQTSFATTKGASEDDKSIRLSLGFHSTLFDRGDPRLDDELLSCFDRVTKVGPEGPNGEPILPPTPLGPNPTDEERRVYEEAQRKYDEANEAVGAENTRRQEECRKESRKRNWNRSSWIIAGAPSWISTTGRTSNFRWNGGGIWSSLAYGFERIPALEKTSQLIFHARYRNKEMVPNPEESGKFLKQDSLFFGSRMRIGTDTSTVSFEGVFARTRPEGKRFDNSGRFSFGLERRVAEDMWFNISLGGETGRREGNNNAFVLTSFKWGFSDKKAPQK